MNAENSHKLGWIRIGIPNDTPEEGVDGLVFDVADHILEEVIYVSGDYTRVGTTVEASLMAKDYRDLVPRDQLSEVDKIERDRVESLYHDFEFDQ